MDDFLQMAKSVTKEENALKALKSLMSSANKHLIDALSLFGIDIPIALAMSFIDTSNRDLHKKFDCRKVLMAAIRIGSQQVVELMLSKGIDVNYKLDDENNTRLLVFAVVEKQLEIVKFLLKQGADVGASCTNGVTALTFAAAGGDIKVLQVLIDSGANVHATDDSGSSLIHYVILGSDLSKDKVDRQQVLKFLLEKGVDINGKNQIGLTPLHLAIDKKCNDLVKLLLNNDAISIEEAESEDQLTPLFLAVFTQDKEIVKLLLDRGANTSAQNGKGNTALYFAIKLKNEELVKILLDHGADFNIVNNEGLSSFHNAATKNIIEMLLSRGADINSRTENDTDFNGCTALGLAALRGREEEVETLIKNGAEIDIQDRLGHTPLFHAVCHGHLGIVKLLLDGGASLVSEMDDELIDPLYYAAWIGQKEILELLLKYKADVNAECDRSGCPAVLAAARKGREDIVDILLSHGANITPVIMQNVTRLRFNDIAKVFVKELVRRKFVDSCTIDDDIIACIKEYEFLETFLADCESELKKSNETFPGTTVTYISVLRMGLHDLATIAANEIFLNAIDFDDFLDLKFPVYGSTIAKSVWLGIERKKLLDQLARFFNCLYDDDDEKLPRVAPNCTEKIFQYLDDEDLKTLIGVFVTSKRA